MDAITCAGNTFTSRVAGSPLCAVGLPELVAHGLIDYAPLAVALLANAPRLQALRSKLAGQRLVAPLFDVAAYTLGLEALYAEMWQRHQDGLAPRGIGG